MGEEKKADIDDRILKLLSQDDPEATTRLYHAYYRMTYNLVRRILEDPEETEDVVLELFVAIWEKRHTLQISKPIGAYLNVAAHNRALNAIRQRTREAQRLQRIAFGSGGNSPPDAELEAQELKDIIDATIAKLPEKARTTYKLSRHSHMTYKQIATKLQVTEKAVQKNISIALKAIRSAVDDYMRQ